MTWLFTCFWQPPLPTMQTGAICTRCGGIQVPAHDWCCRQCRHYELITIAELITLTTPEEWPGTPHTPGGTP